MRIAVGLHQQVTACMHITLLDRQALARATFTSRRANVSCSMDQPATEAESTAPR